MATESQQGRFTGGFGLPNQWLQHVLILVSVFLMALPLLLAFVMSTQSVSQIYNVDNLGFGGHAVDNYYRTLTDHHLLRYMLNSVVMAVVIVVGKIVLSLLAGLVLVYYQFAYKRLVFGFVLLTLLLPVPVRIVPLFQLMANLGWANSLLAITAPYLASATTVFLLRQHFMTIPIGLVESARLDGVGPLRFLYKVLIPMSRGMIAGVAVINFVYAWNQYLWPITVISAQQKQVVQVGIKFLQSSSMSGQTQWGMVMAGAILALLPPLVVLIALRKYLLQTVNA